MDSKHFIKVIWISFFLLVFLSGCAAPVRVVIEPPVKLDGFLNTKWGASVEEVKRSIQMDGNKWFEDHTGEPPHALYAFGSYWDDAAVFSYFFTPESKKIYRVDVTFNNLKVYGKAKDHLIQKLKGPSYSQLNVDHWSWEDKSLVILQKDDTDVQISYSSGPLLIQNQKEGGLLRK